MKKVLSLLVVAAAVLMGSAMAQTDSHDVSVTIPNLLRLRIVNGSTAEAAAPSVAFDYNTLAANVDKYIAEVNGTTSGGLAPTTVTDFGNVIVFSNRTSWEVRVNASALGFADTFTLGVAAGGVALSDIVVKPSGVKGTGVTTVAANWDLANTSGNVNGDLVANGAKTTGWSSLGFSGNDYKLTVNGDENPGTYTTTVTYTIIGL